jgi:hypothetical protein
MKVVALYVALYFELYLLARKKLIDEATKDEVSRNITLPCDIANLGYNFIIRLLEVALANATTAEECNLCSNLALTDINEQYNICYWQIEQHCSPETVVVVEEALMAKSKQIAREKVWELLHSKLGLLKPLLSDLLSYHLSEVLTYNLSEVLSPIAEVAAPRVVDNTSVGTPSPSVDTAEVAAEVAAPRVLNNTPVGTPGPRHSLPVDIAEVAAELALVAEADVLVDDSASMASESTGVGSGASTPAIA